jgi:hypothetical protein
VVAVDAATVALPSKEPPGVRDGAATWNAKTELLGALGNHPDTVAIAVSGAFWFKATVNGDGPPGELAVGELPSRVYRIWVPGAPAMVTEVALLKLPPAGVMVGAAGWNWYTA